MPEQETSLAVSHTVTAVPEEDMKDDGTPIAWPRLLLCDDWIMPVGVMRKPCLLQQPHDKLRAGVAKNFLLVTLMSLNATTDL